MALFYHHPWDKKGTLLRRDSAARCFFGTWGFVYFHQKVKTRSKEGFKMKKNFSQMTDEEKRMLFMEMAKKFGGVD